MVFPRQKICPITKQRVTADYPDQSNPTRILAPFLT
jgi:hypothetical protein